MAGTKVFIHPSTYEMTNVDLAEPATDEIRNIIETSDGAIYLAILVAEQGVDEANKYLAGQETFPDWLTQ